MARMLSGIARQGCCLLLAVLGVSAAVTKTLAEEEIRVSTPPGAVVANPFVKGASARPTVVPDEPDPRQRGPITYQNPFVRMQAARPMEAPLRRGPVSRWRRPVVPLSEVSPIKTAILSAEPIAGARVPWNELPPAEELRDRLPARKAETDAPASTHFGEPPDPVRFVPQPISQPNWLAPHRDDESQSDAAAEQIQFRQTVVNDPFEKQTPDEPVEQPSASQGPVIGSPNGESAVGNRSARK